MKASSPRIGQQQDRERRLHQQAHLYGLWAESERVLNILRSQSGTPPKPITTTELVRWASNAEAVESTDNTDAVEHFLFGPKPEKTPKTPAAWFAKMFPQQVQTRGPAMLESVSLNEFGEKKVTPVSLNEDFLAGVLGGDKRLKHHVAFYEPEGCWYFFDPRLGAFVPTTEAKLQMLLSQYFIRCAREMPSSVHIGPLFNEFRSEETLKRVTKRARALLAADGTFFSAESPHKRSQGPEVHTRITKQFVREAIKPVPGELLPIDQCFTAFAEYCKAKRLGSIARKQFKEIVAEVIKEEFDVGFRHDLQTGDRKYQRGWRGLSLSVPSNVSFTRN